MSKVLKSEFQEPLSYLEESDTSLRVCRTDDNPAPGESGSHFWDAESGEMFDEDPREEFGYTPEQPCPEHFPSLYEDSVDDVRSREAVDGIYVHEYLGPGHGVRCDRCGMEESHPAHREEGE